MGSLPTLSPLTIAIANAESSGGTAGVGAVANNPGNLFLGDQGYGVASNGETIFGDMTTGWTALENQVQKMLGGTSTIYNPNMTIQQAAQNYVGGNDPQGQTNWMNNVSQQLGATPQTTLAAANAQSAGNSAPSSSSSSDGSMMQQFKHALNPFSDLTDFSVSTIERILLSVIGIVAIAAALFSFKTTQNVIQTGTKVAKKGVELFG